MTATIKQPFKFEKAVLGALLIQPSLFAEIKKILRGRDFRYFTHQEIFNNMSEIYKRKKSFDKFTICECMPTKTHYIYKLANECCSTDHIKLWANIVCQKAIQMEYIERAHNFTNIAFKKQANVVNYLTELNDEIKNHETDFDYANNAFVSINQLLTDLINVLDYI